MIIHVRNETCVRCSCLYGLIHGDGVKGTKVTEFQNAAFNNKITAHDVRAYTRVYPKVSGLVAWSESCKWYSSLPLGAVLSLLWVSLVSFAVIILCVASQRVFIVVYFVIDSVRKLLDTPSYLLESRRCCYMVRGRYYLQCNHSVDL